ncbi:MAG: FAD-dependent oxidoreductase [Bacteroides sp.]|nr:FAD-dependent oxidoreductase [Bacteroides sp.]
MRRIHKLIALFAIGALILMSGCGSADAGKAEKAEVVIYGGTSAAVIAAVQLVQMGREVLIVCPETHLGGMSSSGLGFTDTGDKSVIGGLSREFYQRVYDHYQDDDAWRWQARDEYGNVGQGTPAIDGDLLTMWIFEPHVAENIFEAYIAENLIRVLRDEWLDRDRGVEVVDGKILSISMLSGKTFKAEIFVDATYEGDLMAAAGVSYHVGREANSVYNEQWNGVQCNEFHHGHNFGERNISPYVIPGDPSSGVLPRISIDPPGEQGSGDKKVQAYNYRLCTTNAEGNIVPFKRPASYDSTQYELLVRVYEKGWRGYFGGGKIPNNKRDVNNAGPFSSDNIGMNYDYPEASYERRKEILEEHKTYHQGLLYFASSDPRVPESVQRGINAWGLAKDEFQDNDHWPYQIYVREARRMIGEFVMTDNEILGRSEVSLPIAMGSYFMDSHNTQRYITPEGYVQNEGDLGVDPGGPYKIHLGTILPKREECLNLIVPVAVSSSHIAFGSIRMEPVFMILGQSTGIIAGMALEKDMNIHDLDYFDIKSRLIEAGQILNIK